MSYDQLPGFEHVYLEDSYVTGIEEQPDRLRFTLEVVLTVGHPLYRPPAPDEQYCYRPGALEFPALRRVTWTARHLRPFRDASGSVDYGNVDVFTARDGVYHLEGDWGSVEVVSGPPRLDLSPADGGGS